MNRTSPSPYRRLPALVFSLVLCGAIMGWVALRLVKEHLIATTGDALAPAMLNRALWRVGVVGGSVMVPLVGVLFWSMRRLRMECGRVTASEAHFAATLRSITEGVITTDNNGRVTMTNSAAELFTGWNEAEARGRPLNEILHLLDSQSRERLEPIVVPLARGSQMTGLPQRGTLVAADQTERIVAQTAGPIFDTEGASKGMVIVLRDITERVRADERRFATALRLETQNAALAAQARNPVLRGSDSQAAFRSITEVAALTLNVARSSIWLYTDDRSAIRCVDLYENPAGCHSSGIELRLEQFPRYFAALDEDRVVAAHDARNDPRTNEFLTSYLDPLCISSMLDAPIHSGARVVGVICHEHLGPQREWTLDEQSFAGSTADLATLSFEVGQRHQAERALQKAHADLEKRVAERTAELSETNAALQDEIAVHKRLEAALRESEARFRELADAVPQFVWTSDPEGRNHYVNQRWCDYTGLTVEQTHGDGWLVAVHPEDRDQAGEYWTRAVETGSTFEAQYRLRCAADGSYRWHLARAMPVRDADGRIARWFGTGTDIEQQKRLEAALRESEASFRLLVATIPGLVWTASPNGAVEWVSQRAVEYIGRPAEEIIGAGWQEFVHSEDLPQTLEIWGRSLATGEPAEIEYRLRGGDGTYRWHLVRALPLRDPSERIIKWFGTNVDIHDRKRVEKALADARDAALEADRLKSEFLAMMSHELRTPLNSIIGFTGILREEIVGALNDEQKKQLGMIHSSARHLLGMINDLLDLSRIESGKMDVFVERFRLADVVREVTQSLAPLVQARKLLFQTELPTPDIELCSDRKKVFQILLNVANNAVKFTEQGRVTIVARAAADAVVFEVSDTGIGITPEQLANLFQAFRQADGSARRLYEGTGLGLYLCKKLVTLLGGTIGAESEFGVGSRFRFTIPHEPPV